MSPVPVSLVVNTYRSDLACDVGIFPQALGVMTVGVTVGAVCVAIGCDGR